MLAYVVSELWIASRKYDPGRYGSFRQFADSVVRRRTIDWIRLDLGRTRCQFGDGHVYERNRPTFLSLDGPGGDRLDGAFVGGEEQFEAGRLDLCRLFGG